jgi:hypothetical protein
MASPPIPSTYPWARGNRPSSTHTTGAAGFFRYNSNPFLLAGIFLLIGGLLIGVYFGRGPQTGTLLPGLLFGLVAVPLVVWAIVRFQGLVHEVRLFPEGIVWLQGGQWRGWLWEEIEEVYRAEVRVNGGISVKHVILKGGGRKVTLQYALSRWDKMADAIQMEITSCLLPQARADYDSGEELRFGSVSISQDGLRIEKSNVAFDEIKNIEIGNGSVIVYLSGRKGACKVASFSEIANSFVFLKLLEESPAPPVRLLSR